MNSVTDMATKSSDGETKNGSSSESQSTDPMETCTGVDSLLGKRKAEEDEYEDDEEEDEDSDSHDSEWDKDSFDGREYNSSDDKRDYINKELEKKTRFYNRKVIETKGFFETTSEFPDIIWSGIGRVSGLDKKMSSGETVREFLANMACLCLEKYNNQKGFNVKLENVLRANCFPGGKTKYYITFSARESDSPDAPLVEYQAKVARAARINRPILCRPTHPPKLGNFSPCF